VAAAAAAQAQVGRCRLKPVHPKLKGAWFQRLKLKCNTLDLSLVLNFNVRRYTQAVTDARAQAAALAAARAGFGGRDAAGGAAGGGGAGPNDGDGDDEEIEMVAEKTLEEVEADKLEKARRTGDYLVGPAAL